MLSTLTELPRPRAGDPVRRQELEKTTQEVATELLTNGQREKWERYVSLRSDATPFHTLAWHDAIRATFGHEPFYLLAYRQGLAADLIDSGRRVAGVLPLSLVNSRLGGAMLVSVPYAVGGGMLADNDEVAQALFRGAMAIADRENVRWIELRSREALLPDLPVNERYVTFERELPLRSDEVLDWLPRKARAAARNGRDKFGLTIDYGDEHLPEVWRMYTLNMRRLASIAYPFCFLRELAEVFSNKIWVSLVRWQGSPVAGLVTFLHRERVMPYFFGCTNAARRCSAANFIYFKTMERAVAAGYRVFDFGRSRRENSGSFDFKRFHGFDPTPLRYQFFALNGESAPNLTPDNAKFRLARWLWPRLPLRLTQWAGGYLSRHIPG